MSGAGHRIRIADASIRLDQMPTAGLDLALLVSAALAVHAALRLRRRESAALPQAAADDETRAAPEVANA